MNPTSVKFNDEEKQAIADAAREQGIYEHGLIRSLVRYGLGLPVSSSTVRFVEEQRQSALLGSTR